MKILTPIYLVFIMLLPLSGSSQLTIEFVDTPVIYPVGAYGENKGVFAPFTRKLNRDSIEKIIRVELKKYPLGLLENKARLRTIILSDTMLVADEHGEFTEAALGTYLVPAVDGNIVFINATTIRTPAILHHEISSVFLCELATTDTLFNERTKKIFEYFYDNTSYYKANDNIRREIIQTGDWPINKDNFFVLGNNGYALMDAENDFNVIVESLFCPKLLKQTGKLLVDRKLSLWQFLDKAKAEKYEVYNKLKMVIDYYSAVNPVFNEQYFREIER